MDPINYSTAVANPIDSALKGYQQGIGISQIQQAQAAQQQQQAAAQQQSQVIQSLVNNPNATADDYSKAQILVPGMAEQLGKAWSTKNAAQQQSQISDLSQWSAAIQNGQPQIAVDAMNARADALENTANGPTPDSQALRAQANTIQAHPEFGNFVIKSLLAAHPDGAKVINAIVAQNKDQREQDQAPAELRLKNADAAGKEADATQKATAIIGSAAGSLQGKGATPAQLQTMFKSQAAKGVISKDEAQQYIDAIPTDPAVREQWLGTFQMAGLKPEEQVKLTTPDANSKLSAATQLQTTRMNNSTQLAVQDKITERENAGDDAANLSADSIDNAAARYNTDGTLPPMGMGAAAAAGRTKILNRAAEMKKGVDPAQQRLDQLGNKGQVASQNAAMKQFTSGKLGSSVRSFNVGLSHLDTLGNLADALDNKDTQAVNRIGNYFATQTGSSAPTSFNAAKKIVGDEIVKAIVGSGGGVADREEAAKTISAANSPAQLKATIKTYKELMVGQLSGLEQQYTTSTGRNDFNQYLSPQALAIKAQHAPTKAPIAAPVAAIPGGWSVREH